MKLPGTIVDIADRDVKNQLLKLISYKKRRKEAAVELEEWVTGPLRQWSQAPDFPTLLESETQVFLTKSEEMLDLLRTENRHPSGDDLLALDSAWVEWHQGLSEMLISSNVIREQKTRVRNRMAASKPRKKSVDYKAIKEWVDQWLAAHPSKKKRDAWRLAAEKFGCSARTAKTAYESDS